MDRAGRRRDRRVERRRDRRVPRKISLSFCLSVSPPFSLSFLPFDGVFARLAQEVFDDSRLSSRCAFNYFSLALHVFRVVGLSPQYPRPPEQGVELCAQAVKRHRYKVIFCARGVLRRFAQLLFPAPTKAIFDDG